DPSSVDAATRALFERWTPPNDAHDTATTVDLKKIVGTVNLAQSVREYGHLAAQLDPLGSPPPGDPSLELEAHGITEDDLRELPAWLIGGPVTERTTTAYDAIEALRDIYSG